jgi:hypothetical protein
VGQKPPKLCSWTVNTQHASYYALYLLLHWRISNVQHPTLNRLPTRYCSLPLHRETTQTQLNRTIKDVIRRQNVSKYCDFVVVHRRDVTVSSLGPNGTETRIEFVRSYPVTSHLTLLVSRPTYVLLHARSPNSEWVRLTRKSSAKTFSRTTYVVMHWPKAVTLTTSWPHAIT